MARPFSERCVFVQASRVGSRIDSKVEALQRELGRLEGRLELTKVAESTLWDHLERERKRADEERERANRLEEELREARRSWWRRWFDA